MEQVGIAGLPPLMPSIPSAIPVAIPETGSDPSVSTLTELVTVRTAKQTTAAECLLAGEPEGSSGSNTVKSPALAGTAEAAFNRKMPQTPQSASGESPTQAATVSPQFAVPPHLLGRSLENPLNDPVPPGRKLQKPRLGVRVPHRNLTSQIVSQNELAQELLERSMKKLPLTPEEFRLAKSPAYPFFSQKLAERLSKSLAPSTSLSTPRTPALTSFKKPSLLDGARLSPGFTYPEREKLNSSTPSPAPTPAASPAPAPAPAATTTASTTSTGDAELLSILEGSGDPLWLPDKLVKKESRSHLPPVLLDPILERELALKQLQELPAKRETKKKPKRDKNEEPKKGRTNKKSKKDEIDTSVEQVEVNGADAIDKELGEAAADFKAAAENKASTPKGQVPADNKASTPKGQVSADKASTSKGQGSADNKTPTPKGAGRKRKMSADVAAVLKKPTPPKGKKTVKAVANGKTPKGSPRKTPKVALKKKEAKPAKNVVANGTPDKVSPALRKRGRPKKGKDEEVKEVEPAAKKRKVQTTPKPAKQGATPSAKVKKTQAQTTKPEQIDKVRLDQDDQNEELEESQTVVEKPESPREAVSKEPKEAPKEVPKEGAVSGGAPASKPEQSAPTRVRELDRLLGDEGAVNLLFDVDGSSASGAPSRRTVPSKDLALRARLVKTAVLRLSQTSQGHVPLALRARRSLAVSTPPRLPRMVGEPRKRQSSVDSRDAPRSPPNLTPMDVSPSHSKLKTYSDGPRMKLTADASRIIRRHSSSSTFSSPSESPRRLSVDRDNNLDVDGQRADGASSTTPGARKKGVPIFVRDSAETTYSGKKKPRVVNPAAVDSTALSLSESARKLLELQCKDMKVKKTLVPNPAALKKKDLKKISSQVKNKVKSEMFKNFKKGLDGAVVLAAKKAGAVKMKKAMVEVKKSSSAEEMETDGPTSMASRGVTPPPSTSRGNSSLKRDSDKAQVPLSPDASSYSNLIKTLKHDQKTRRVVEDRQRASVRHCAGTYTYRELTVRRYDNVVQIILAPVSTKIRSGLNVQVLRELRDALHQVKKDDTCRVVLLTSAGSSFCQGIDVSILLHNNVDKRKAAAIDLIVALKDFLKCLASFPKPLIAGVHGPTVGLGVTMLPLFDMVFASQKATFHTPYARLGQVPEGAATLTLPYMLGYTLTSELLLGCREMTASEAFNCGLVTRTMWPDRFLEDLIPLVKTFATQSAQSMDATKALLRHGLRTKFDAALESESHLLVTHWTSKECQDALRGWLDSGAVSLQRPRLPDA